MSHFKAYRMLWGIQYFSSSSPLNMIHFKKCYLNKKYLWNNFISIQGSWFFVSKLNAIFKLAPRSFFQKLGRSGMPGVSSGVRERLLLFRLVGSESPNRFLFESVRPRLRSAITRTARDVVFPLFPSTLEAPYHTPTSNQTWGC